MTGTYPKHNTQAARLLSLLLAGRDVGPLAGWRELGIYRLADTKHQLRKAGWEVGNAMVSRDNRFGESCRLASYRLPAAAIEAAGADGQEFAQREAKLMADILRARRGA